MHVLSSDGKGKKRIGCPHLELPFGHKKLLMHCPIW